MTGVATPSESTPPDPVWSEVKRLTEHSGWVHSAQISPNGVWLASANEDGNVYVYEIADNYNLVATLSIQSGYWCTDVAWSADSSLISFCEYHPTNAAANQRIYVYSTATWSDATGNTYLAQITARCREIVFSPDGNYIAFTAETGTFWIYKTSDWTLETSKSVQAEGIDWSPDGTMVAIANTPNSKAIIYNTSDWSVKNTFSDTGASRGERVTFSPDSSKLAFGDSALNLYVYDTTTFATETGTPVKYTGAVGQMRGMSWSDNNMWLAYSMKDGGATKVFVFDVLDGYTEETAITIGTGGAYGVSFGPGTTKMVVGAQSGGYVIVYNV